jgi:putative ABC transport system ATP-binding protein
MSEEMVEPVISVSNLQHHYGDGKLRQKILNDINTHIHQGEIIILTGPSGSGKTTLLTLLGALRSAQQGSLKIFGHELRGGNARVMQSVRRQIGYIFQSHNLINALTASQNVAMSLHLHKHIKRRDRSRLADEMLDAVGLAEHKHKYPGQLSGGQQQRVGIARALVAKPRIVLADEPTASLDRHAGREVVDLMKTLAREQQTTVIIVTHDNRILDVADHILHLEDGRMQPLSVAIAENASQLLTLLERHDPDRSHFISIFSHALVRVAFADKVLAEEERQIMRETLVSTSGLSEPEVDLVVELAMAQVGMSHGEGVVPTRKPFTETQGEQFMASLFAVANADGAMTEDERAEIEAIRRELDFLMPPPGNTGD